ncbi:MAG: ATP-binding protein [Candidatus Melainabacteria bacterium]|nr:ATP-binding protein [Candidatus Melainabacteria bacterium]
MPIRLSIRKKGLLIVAVPLLFQLIFVGMLYKELERANAETLEEVHARSIISAVDRLFVHSYEASSALYMYAFTQSPMTEENFEKGITEIQNDLRFLKDNSKHDKKVFAYLNREMHTSIQALRDQKRMIQEDRHPGDNLARLTGYMRVRKMVHHARDLAGAELYAYSKPERSFEARQEAVRRVMLLGLIGNLVIAFGIASFFGKSIEQRLKRVLTNVDLFSKKKALLPPMVVTDEIGVVDSAFHEMAGNLRRAERIRQDFVAMIGHDIRTPATTIKLTLDTLDEDSASLDSGLRELVSDAAGESRRLMTLTNNLLDLTQIELGRFQVDARPLQVANAINQAVRSLTLYAQSKKITMKNESSDFTVNADYERLLQVLINLLSNAVKYSPRNSEIAISTAKVDDDFVEIEIVDNGAGIPAEKRDKIFEAHERLTGDEEGEQHGMGLGLAICKSIVQAHGGTIGVRESSTGGSAFWFRLPVADGTKDE